MQLVVLDGWPINPNDLSWDCLKEFGTLSVYDRTDSSMVARRIRGADIVLTNKVKVTGDDIRSDRALKMISVLATGYDPVDIAVARELGIPVCNVPAYSTAAVAQLAISHMLELFEHVGLHTSLVHRGAWSASPDFTFWREAPVELNGLTLGILGCGQIGRRVAVIGKALGMKVIGTNPSKNPDFVGEYVEFDELLRFSDVISLHCPAKKETIGIIDSDAIAKMKDGAILINTARGSLIVESDVREALESGKLGGLGVDVVSSEPMSVHNPLLGAPNCTITPHYGWAPKTARVRLLDVTCANIRAFLNGQPQNQVN
ncbi:MAG: D-2-hydroxyacid dehydrogenase [Eubacteriales bacterium]|nr:D-2-hydroxyacid dehydrogenase [Eubacteriales bacterium]